MITNKHILSQKITAVQVRITSHGASTLTLFVFPMSPHVLMNFRGFLPGYGNSVADF